MGEIEKLKRKLVQMSAEQVDRALFGLRMWCIYEIPGYADLRDRAPKDTGFKIDSPEAKRDRERDAKALEAAIPLAVERFERMRAEAVAEELARERFREWQQNRIPGVA